MGDESSKHFDRVRNIWAPWRIEYIESLKSDDDGCFLCQYRDDPDNDEKNLVLWRSQRCLAVLNRFPYNGGHALVAPLQHVGTLSEFDSETMLEMMEMVRDLQLTLAEAIDPQGFNVGINLGRCAGAGLPGHLHTHIVPRWSGDTNFMTVCSDVRVIPTSLQSLYDQLTRTARRMGLPKLSQVDLG